ncbi:SMI1/KNR4 family protein [Pseudomonas mangiferae]|uniref:SMI1/KNR4 family protein n=1 Tax=Pseudomonas mangiferae TaxID=2593654 RepID=A0A553GZ29_9PSED|nr:SMI1/KNR4 family protein [Pseudomonas mangiferae]TRX74769.1 SMI1/KNR4 family protein [Pseudomonas mangiferae]
MTNKSIEDYISNLSGDVLRDDVAEAITALNKLGINKGSDFWEFYVKYQGPFISPRDKPELLDLIGPEIPAILDQTEYVKDRYEIGEEFLAITSDESEGMYLYSISKGDVYDLDISDLKDFLNGKLAPRWGDFGSFLIWYFKL